MPLKLYGYPGACSLVAHIALEIAGADFTVEKLDLPAGAQRTPEYLALHPRGKVPLLVTDEGPVTETIGILAWLSDRFPEAGLLAAPGARPAATALSDLSWFASSVHPTLTRMAVPMRFSEGCHDSIRAIATAAAQQEFTLIDARLRGRRWWLDAPSALDGYIFWLWARSGDFGLDRSQFHDYAAHAARTAELPPVKAALARERSFAPCYENILL